MPQAEHGRSQGDGAPAGQGRRSFLHGLGVCCLVALVTASAVGAALPNDPAPGQRIDLKVLLLSADGTEPGFGAWQAALDREGVPYDTFVAYDGQAKAATLTDERLADYAADHAKYQAVILASGDLGRNLTNRNDTTSYLSALTDAEWAALARFERTFGIRRLSDFTAPSPAHGLTVVGGISQDGRVGTLTPAGRAAFPYLKGPIPVADDIPAPNEAFGYEGTPVNAADWQTLVAAPAPGSAYLGIYTHPGDGREEMVMTLAGNQFQSHHQALRHGMLNWVTRGVFLGYQRSYLGLDVDDVFLGDDKWDPVANVTNYEFANAIRMTPQDVANAVAWQDRTGLRMTMVYNLGGVDLYGGAGGDPLLPAFRAAKNEFRWVNHTLQHPNLDCTSQPFTRTQLTANQARFDQLLAPVAAGLNDPTEAVTGEHSGLANVRPGNPGTIDPPAFDDLTPTAGTLAAGAYDYAITARSPAGETVASIATTEVLPAGSGIVASFNAVCHAVSFQLYRRPSGGTDWALVGSLARGARDAVDTGTAPLVLSITDTGGAGTPAAPPAANGAALAPYTQNPGYVPALTAAGITTVASDASKPYPNPPAKGLPLAEGDPTNFPKGAGFPVSPSIQAVPRYPSNVYYNVANRADQLDEYNWIYTAPPLGGCVPIPQVTTCNAAPVTWEQYLTSETRIMLGHLTGNDPRPHYFHQTNIAQSDLARTAADTSVGGTLYAVIDTLLARYDQVFDRAAAPLVQLTQRQVAATLAQQDAWAATRRAGTVTAWLQDGAVHIASGAAAAVDVPVTGTTAGAAYGGQTSGWITLAPGTAVVLEPSDPAKAAPPAIAGGARVGGTLTATGGTWTGTPEIVRRFRWQRCDARGLACRTIGGANGGSYEVTAADVGATLRVVVSAGNWISAVGQAASPATGVVPKPPAPRGAGARPDAGGGAPKGGRPDARRRAPALTRVRMSPRRFAVAHRRPKLGTRLDGSTITWRLDKAAKVRLKFQRVRGKRAARRFVTVGVIKRSAKAGAGVVRFRGRFGPRLLAPGRYRLVATAAHRGARSKPVRIRFRVVRG
jgi:hypothetical protein